MQKFLFLFSLILFLGACDTTSKTTNPKAPIDNPSRSCFTKAVVKDMRDLDGCQFLLELDNGDKLMPIEVKDKDFKFENNQLVEIGYKEEKDAMTTCMAGTPVTLTCIKLVDLIGGVKPAIPQKVPCEKLNAPFDRNWMKEHVIRLKPTKIDRYDYLEDGWAYHLVNDNEEYIYDCQGTLLCDGKPGNEKCQSYLARMKNKFTIWVVNN